MELAPFKEVQSGRFHGRRGEWRKEKGAPRSCRTFSSRVKIESQIQSSFCTALKTNLQPKLASLTRSSASKWERQGRDEIGLAFSSRPVHARNQITAADTTLGDSSPLPSAPKEEARLFSVEHRVRFLLYEFKTEGEFRI
ncbi:hypothetical protein AVEN_125300-1 [Araneus ventricosus]|uniref:Uncharacterized protein n=1 Tax=Araneus ventricosus TaxID=182803 RepID=A0A4Y2ENC5_ARAVE|nr:hypothetical protein AVEN_125300-1 [Araneus ventricosus]